jgi:hypothetical protein
VANNKHTTVIYHRNADFPSSMLVVQAKMLDIISSMTCYKFYSTDTDPAMAQPHYDLYSMAENSLDFLLEKLME